MSITQIENDGIFCSVVMPVHNGERFLREAIESVLNQTYTNFEFLIIENCSADSSVDIIKSYSDARIRLIIETDCGQVQAYNRGFKEAKGEYIFIHDQDDISHPKRFEKQLNCMIDYNIDICGSFLKLINEKGRILTTDMRSVDNNDIKNEVLYKSATIHNSSICINRRVFTEIGYWESTNYPVADCEFFIRASFSRFNFRNVPEFLYSYRRHSSQITASNKRKAKKTFRKIAIGYVNNKFKEKRKIYQYTGLIYYYTGNNLLAFYYLLTAFLFGEKSRKTKNYLIKIFFFGVFLSLIRRTKFIETDHFVKIKNTLIKTLNL